MATLNHVHLLVRSRGDCGIPRAVQSGEHLARCMVYISLNMVWAGRWRLHFPAA